MKNLFKSLMLVAVAAMAFTACSQDNNEVNKLTKKTSIDFIASIGDDTRSGFGDKVGDKYVSKWDGLEGIIAVAHTDSGDVVAYTTIDEEGKGEFTAEFETNDVITRVDFYTPSYSWMTWEEIVAYLPQTQKPRANSVDPSAHILRGSIEVVNNEAQGHVNFKHEFAYGKMTLNLPEDFKVETVNLAFNGVDEEYQKLELSADNVENNVFWFTTIPMNVATFTVEATAKNGAIATKEVTVDKAGDLVFEQGHVSTFSVSNLDISLYDYEVILTKVIAINGNKISFEGENPQDRATIEFNTGLASIVAGTYSGVDASYGPGYSSNDALEFNYNGSTFNSSESYSSSYDMYFGSNDIVISDLGGDAIRVETVQETWVSALNKSCRFRIFFEGALDIEEPAVPVFTSAAWVNTSLNDKYIRFYSDEFGTLQLNFYNCNSDKWLDARTYGFANSGDIYYGGDFSWYENKTAGIDAEICDGTVIVAVVDGKYFIEFKNLVDWDGNVYIEYATFTGQIFGLELPDTREKLAMPNATATVEGRTIKISWNAVDNVDGYRVKLYSPYDEYFEEVVTGTEYVYEAQLWNTQYSFTIMSYASDDNKTYKSSDDAYVDIMTEKDPNVFADVVATNIIWDSSNGAFKMTGEVVSGTAWGYSSDYIRLYMNEADRPGNNSIKVGQYTGCGGTSPQAGQFGARLSLYWGNVTYPSAVGSASTVDVTYDEVAGYTIVLTHNGVTYGYKGMPEGWVAPSEGSDEPDPNPEPEPDPDQPDDVVADGTSIDTAYTFTTYSTYKDGGYPVMCLSGAENGATFNFESNSQIKYPTGFQYFNSGAWFTGLCEYSINGEGQSVDVDKSVIWLEGDNTNGYTVEYIYIVTGGSNGIYYKYDGKFFL